MPYATNEKTVSNGWLYVEYKWRHHYSSTNLSRNPPSICLCKMCSGSRSILRGWPHRRTSMVWKVRGLTLPITKCSHSQSLNCKSSLWNRRIMSLNKHTRIDKIHISVKKKKKKVLLHKEPHRLPGRLVKEGQCCQSSRQSSEQVMLLWRNIGFIINHPLKYKCFGSLSFDIHQVVQS